MSAPATFLRHSSLKKICRTNENAESVDLNLRSRSAWGEHGKRAVSAWCDLKGLRKDVLKALRTWCVLAKSAEKRSWDVLDAVTSWQGSHE